MRIRTIGLIGVWAAAWAAAGEAPLDAFRTYRIERDTFDYTFTSYAETGGPQPLLSFNHRSGRTYFVKAGDKLDTYLVTDFEPVTELVFDSSLNTTRRTKAGKVTLQGAEKQTVVLEMGKALPLPGWRALVVSLKTGGQWSVRAGDRIRDGALTLAVTAVSEDTVTVAADGDPAAAIPMAAEDEKVAVHLLWRQQQREAAEKRQQPLAVADETPGQAGRTLTVENRLIEVGGSDGAGTLTSTRVAGVPGSEPRMFIGTEYRYPTEWDVYIVPNPKDGTYRPIYVPRKFETRMVGTSIGPGPSVSHTTVSPSSPSTDSRGRDPAMVPFPSSPPPRRSDSHRDRK